VVIHSVKHDISFFSNYSHSHKILSTYIIIINPTRARNEMTHTHTPVEKLVAFILIFRTGIDFGVLCLTDEPYRKDNSDFRSSSTVSLLQHKGQAVTRDNSHRHTRR